jgi:hypothetical protein
MFFFVAKGKQITKVVAQELFSCMFKMLINYVMMM